MQVVSQLFFVRKPNVFYQTKACSEITVFGRYSAGKYSRQKSAQGKQESAQGRQEVAGRERSPAKGGQTSTAHSGAVKRSEWEGSGIHRRRRKICSERPPVIAKI